MPILLSKIDTVVLPSHEVFCLYSREEREQRDLAEAERLASADGVGFAWSAVGVRVATEVSKALVSVETWSGMPLLLRDQGPFDFAWEGVVDFPDGRWCISESLDSLTRLGVELPSGPGRCGVRVVAYNHNDVLDRYEMAQAGTDEEFAAMLAELKRLDPETAERYQIQLWPVRRQRGTAPPDERS
ncbi:hypothetical protein ACGFIR_04160 [Micromonospora sp. NPDC049051]|uniref:hypothetical protein n=1 Tax=Micromonospora sp. NPDC049051 TaxID=3364264 RepID=UPI00371F7D10